MNPIRLFWWSPRRSARLAWPELRRSGSSWSRLWLEGGGYWRNFGDELSPLVVAMGTRRRVVWASPMKADLVAIGSVLEMSLLGNGHSRVWGSGLRGLPADSDLSSFVKLPERVIAVRGALSRDALGLPTSQPLGDPGVLVPELLHRQRARRSGIVLLPHFRAWGSSAGRSLLQEARGSGMRVVSPARPPLEIASELDRADLVVTSSLHGLITSHALGTPCLLASLGTGVDEDHGFKYRDYASSVGYEVTPLSVVDILSKGLSVEARDRAHIDAPKLAERCTAIAAGLVDALRNSL